MSKYRFQILIILAVTVLCSAVVAQQSATTLSFKVLYAPPGSGIGGSPGLLFEGKPGLFYGYGGFMPVGSGSNIFSIDALGNYKTTYQFPANDLVEAVIGAENGLLYGYGNAQQTGGAGPNYFSMKLDGTALTLYPTGSFGVAGSFAIQSPNGYLYDVMNCPNCELVRIDLQGHITSLFQFSSVGLVTYGGSTIVQGKTGNFYGIVVLPNNGSKLAWIFHLTSAGVFTKIATFDLNLTGGGTTTPLMYASDGNLYGGLAKGGSHRRGSIYRVTPQGQMTTIIDFPVSGIAAPAFLLEADDGNIYGSTNEIPSFLFRFNPASPVLETLYQLQYTDGICGCGFVQGSDGKFYGDAPVGGANGQGTLFTFDVGLAPPKPSLSVVSPTSGAPGKQVLLWGNNLLGTTFVSFNGTPATTFAVTSLQSVFADVPLGATTGPITITTPNGSYATGGNFTVP